MRRAFLINIVLLVLVNVLIKPLFIFGVDLSIQNRAEQGSYGLYFALLNWAYLFQIISDFGLQNFNARLISGTPFLLEKYFPKLLTIKIVLSALYFFLALILAFLFGGYSLSALLLLSVLLFNQLLVQMSLFLRTNISGLGHYKTDSLLSALDKLLMLVFCGLVLWWHIHFRSGYFPMLWFAFAQTVSLIFTVIIVYWVLLSKSKLPRWAPIFQSWSSSKHVIAVLVRKSLPFAIVILLMSAYTRLDSVILERILPDGAYHTDIFAGSYRLLDALNMLGYLFASLLLPMFSRQLALGEPVRPLTVMSFRLIWVGAWTACVSIFFHRASLVSLMFGGKPDLVYRSDVCGILIWSFVAICVTYIFSTLLTAGGQLKSMNRFFIAGLCLDLGLNFLLIPSYKAIGASIATLSTQTFVAFGMIWVCYQKYDIRPSRRGLIQLFAFSVALFTVAYAIKTKVAVNWSIQLTATLMLGVVFGVFTRLIDLKSAYNLIKR